MLIAQARASAAADPAHLTLAAPCRWPPAGAQLMLLPWSSAPSPLQGAIDACKVGLTIAIRYSADRPQASKGPHCRAPAQGAAGALAPGSPPGHLP